MQYQFNLMDWVTTSEDSNVVIPGKFAQIVDRVGTKWKLSNEHLVDSPLCVEKDHLLPFEYTPPHPIFRVKFKFQYMENHSIKDGGEYNAEIPNLTDKLAPVAFIEKGINPNYYRLWAGKLWASVRFEDDMAKPPVRVRAIYYAYDTSNVIVGIKPKKITEELLKKWTSEIILVDGKVYTLIPGEPRFVVVPSDVSRYKMIHVNRVFRYKPEYLNCRYFRIDDTEGLNRHLRELREKMEASTGDEWEVCCPRQYEFLLSGCLRLMPDIEHDAIQEQCFQKIYPIVVEFLQEQFKGDNPLIKRALKQYLLNLGERNEF